MKTTKEKELDQSAECKEVICPDLFLFSVLLQQLTIPFALHKYFLETQLGRQAWGSKWINPNLKKRKKRKNKRRE